MSLFENIFEKIINVSIKRTLLKAYPIGSYYWSENETNPSELFGGEWAQIKDVFLYAAGSIKAGLGGGIFSQINN